MFYILDSRGRVVGSADGSVDAKDLAARGEVAVASELKLSIGEVDVIDYPAKPIIVAREIPVPPRIALTTSAPDDDDDGLADLPADGESQADITATLNDALGEVIKDEVEIQFRTSAGALSSRSEVTKKGVAKVTLTASHDTVMARVSAAANGFEPASIEFEFLPVTKTKGKTTRS